MTRREFTLQVEQCQQSLRRLLTALCCGDTQLADDLAQDALVKAYIAIDTYRGQGRFLTWVYRIAYNCYLTHLRLNASTLTLDEARAAQSADTADASFEYQELYGALALLPPKTRSAVLLFYMEGYASAEIASILQMTDAAVRQHLSRGRRQLRSLLTR